MVIVLFHLLYLLGRLAYRNYLARREKSAKTVEIADETLVFSEEDFMNFDAEAPQDFEDVSNIKFFPPVYIQRYVAVSTVLSEFKLQGKLRKVVDFGCSELNYLTHLKNLDGVEEILCVDIDRTLLETHKGKAEPLVCEYLHCRPAPLVIEICEGSVTHNDTKLEKTDAVVCIELIEHLYPDTLMDLPFNIFGYIRPKIAVFTTPNADFNPLFKSRTKFRHPDHKFEWTRQQFQDWAENIVLQYPDYEVTFHGIGSGPEGTEPMGMCSQMAVFCRRTEKETMPVRGIEGLFKTVATFEYPYKVDNRSDEEKILDEAVYYIHQLSSQDEENREEVPVEEILKLLNKFCTTTETLKSILEEAGWAVMDRENGPVVLVPEVSFSDYTAMEEDFDDDYSLDEDDEWIAEPGPPVQYVDRIREEELVESWREENWDEEESIVIPQNSSVNQEHTYLFDGENLPLDINSVSEGTSEFENNSSRNIEDACTERELPSNSVSLFLDHIDVSFDSDNHYDLNSPTDFTHENGSEDSSATGLKISDVCQERSGINRMLDFQACMSVSRSSTSPQPYLTRTIQSDSLRDDSMMSNQDQFDSWMLNSTFRESDIDTSEKPMSSSNAMDNGDSNSVCSMYLQPSNNEGECSGDNIITCLENVNKQDSDSHIVSPEAQVDGNCDVTDGVSVTSVNSCISDQPQFTSSPRISTKSSNAKSKLKLFTHNRRRDKSEDSAKEENVLESVSQTSLQSNVSVSTTSSNYSTIGKWYQSDKNPMYETEEISLKGGNDVADKNDSTLSESDVSTLDRSVERNELTHLCTSKNETNLAEKGVSHELEVRDILELNETKDLNDTKLLVDKRAKDDTIIASTSVLIAEKDSPQDPKRKNVSLSSITEVIDEEQAKPASPDTLETPPNSWSPEIMDSGYPNSASAQDMTPEYDLSSIAQDHVSDSESPSAAEAPQFVVEPVVLVENGDLANNNRDNEGNNIVAAEANDAEDIRPLIDILEHDIANENDIYLLRNGFPVWLLRILEMANVEAEAHEELEVPDQAAGGDAGYVEHDEGIDSSSDESDINGNEIPNNVNPDENIGENDNESVSSDAGSDHWAAGDT